MEVLGDSLPHIDYGLAEVPFPGEVLSGDKSVVIANSNRISLAVIDGLGHGKEAAAASKLAAKNLEARWLQPIEEQIWACHADLVSTRGVALSIVAINCETRILEWAGVGDVCAVVLHGTEREILTPISGIVSYGTLADLRLQSLHLTPGDLIILATDGVDLNFLEGLTAIGSSSAQGIRPKQIAEFLMQTYYKGTDDALILVAVFREQEGAPQGAPP